MSKFLLVVPAFPLPHKSRNHKNFLPIGLLKIGAWLKDSGHEVRLVYGVPADTVGTDQIQDFAPDEVWITSLFTYWFDYVKAAVQGYHALIPEAKIVVGGIYASLMPRDKVRADLGCDEVQQGVTAEAERFQPDYSLLPNGQAGLVDYQILHASRGCERHCEFCGTWRIEPSFQPLATLDGHLFSRKLVFYDNNFLMNPNCEALLQELIDRKKYGQLEWCESQSGFDGRVLLMRPHLARMIRQAGFRSPRIAWDWGYEQMASIQRQVGLFREAGYPAKEIYVFMVYNWNLPFDVMEEKRKACFGWHVQISDCRFRPLDQMYDHYSGLKRNQTSADYYIHPQWTDPLVKQFRRNVREQNICVRHGFQVYSRKLENKALSKELSRSFRANPQEILSEVVDAWDPSNTRWPS